MKILILLVGLAGNAHAMENLRTQDFRASTILPGSITVPSSVTAQSAEIKYQVKAGSATILGNLTASSGTFTAAGSSQYSLNLSSGILLNDGLLDVSAPGAGIRWSNGISTSMPLMGGGGGGSSYTMVFASASVINHQGTFTNTAPTDCNVSGSTGSFSLAAGKGVNITGMYSSYAANNSTAAVNVFVQIDGCYINVTNFQRDCSVTAAQAVPISFIRSFTFQVIGQGSRFFVNDHSWDIDVRGLSAGVHTYCLAVAVDAGTGAGNCHITNAGINTRMCTLKAKEIP